MKELITSEKQTMSSREIAIHTGKRHSDVLEAIRNMEVAWEKITQRKFPLSEYTDSTGRSLPEYRLDKTECLYVATKFNDEARAKLILRWEELEKQNASQKQFSIPQTYAAALKLAAEQAEENERLAVINHLQEKALIEAAPKVEYHDKVLNAQNTFATTQIAKELGMSAIQLNKELKNRGIHYQVNGQWVLMRKYQDKGYTKTKTYAYYGSGGEGKASMSTVWTQEGRQFIHSLFNSELKHEEKAMQRAGM